MAVSFDAKGSSDAAINGPTSPATDSNLTIGSLATCVIVFVCMATNSTSGTLCSVTGVTWGGTSMTLIASVTSSSGTSTTWAYGLCSPATGNQTISVAFTGGTPADNGIYIDGVSFTGTSTTFATCFPAANVITDASSPPSTVYPASPFSVTTANGDAAVAVAGSLDIGYLNCQSGNLINEDTQLAGNYISGYGLASGTSVSLQFGGATPTGQPVEGIAFRVQQPAASGPPLQLGAKVIVNV